MKKISITKMVLGGCMILLALLIILPLLYVVAISLSEEKEILDVGYRLIPKTLSLAAYKQALANPDIILRSYGVTLLVTVLGSIMSVYLTATIAYTAARRDYRYQKFISYFLIIPLLFNGGMVASYIVNSQLLHLNNSIWALMLPYGVNVWFAFMMKGFMSTIPFELIESAQIDGASEYRIFYTIIVPLSKSSLATIGLFYVFIFWNDWWLAMLYINDHKRVPLQYLLQRIMSNIEFYTNQLPAGMTTGGQIPLEATRMALAVIAIGPMIVIFPFFQKYFTKGVTVGSIKG